MNTASPTKQTANRSGKERKTSIKAMKPSGFGRRMLPEEMIASLDSWTVPNSVSGIVVAFEETTIFVLHDNVDRLETLRNALSLGGLPIGMVGAIHNGDRVYMYREPYGDVEDADCLLQKFQGGMVTNIQKKFSGGAYLEFAPPRRHTLLMENGWLLEFLTDDDVSCPKCSQRLGNCACGFFVDMTPNELVERGFARYLGKEVRGKLNI